jgi:hypothetical protein
VISYDIEPHHPMVQAGDFLTVPLLGDELNSDGLADEKLPAAGSTTIARGNSASQGTLAISNPPFGRANKLCIPFFNKLANHCDYIGFIVPKSWRKWSVQNRLDPHFHLIHDEDLVVNYVDMAGAPLAEGKTGLNTVFQIWQRRDFLRPQVLVENRGYISKCDYADADVALTIFGHGCGTVKTEFPRQPNTTQMFLKLHHTGALTALQNADFAQYYQNVAYIKALSIKEIYAALNQYFDELAGSLGG